MISWSFQWLTGCVPAATIRTPLCSAGEMRERRRCFTASAAAFLTRRYELLRGSFGDCFHQPHRQPLIPFLRTVIAAGEQAGALGGFLSGSGSTICCLVEEKTTGGATANRIAEAMLAASATSGARTIITKADNQGTIVEKRRD